jgi:hypothetical protein
MQREMHIQQQPLGRKPGRPSPAEAVAHKATMLAPAATRSNNDIAMQTVEMGGDGRQNSSLLSRRFTER